MALDRRLMERREGRTLGSRAVRLSTAVVIQIIAWVLGAAMAYGAINARIAVVEAKQAATDSRLERIEAKIDRLLERVR